MPAKPNWRELAEKAAKEKDPEKLAEIINALCHALDEEGQQSRSPGEKKHG